MATIERREQVFVSSTYIDLAEERQEVIQTLLEADCIPAGMELFPASDDDRWTLIQRVIDDCDYYIVLIGGRYGSVSPEDDLSFTEMEYDYAVSVNKPVLAFLHANPGAIPGDKTDLDDSAREKLNAFREKASERMVKHWESPSELGGQVAKSLIQIRKTHPAEGWVRARDAATPEMRAEMAELRARVAELTAELDSAATSARTLPPVDLAQGEDVYQLTYFIDYYTADQVKEGNLYTKRTKRWKRELEATWNDIFAALGPLMIDEESEANLDRALDNFTRSEIADRDDDSLLPDDFGRETKVLAVADVIHDVKIQFFALGLIAQSERRRQVSDKNTYWTLSNTGRDHLMRLRAVRRDESPSDAAEEAG